MSRLARIGADFLTDRRGGIAVMFGIVLMALVMAVGMAVDYGRVVHTRSRLGKAVDAAALAAGRALLDGRLSDHDVQQIALRYFETNMADGATFGTASPPTVKVTRETGEVFVNAEADVPMTLTRIAGFTSVNIPAAAVSRFDDRDIELSLALDITGSMQGSKKIGALKTATKDLIDIMLPDGGTKNKVRVALAPYASGVNAGIYAQAVTGKKNATCTYEREGSNQTGDQAPGRNNYLKTNGDSGIDKNATCPSGATVIPLSTDKQALKRAVDRYVADGYTAGHLGAMWGQFLLSPNWAGVFGAQSAPVGYNDRRTVKAMVLMSDGQFNTVGGKMSSANEEVSQQRAVEICRRMRSNSVLVYAVGFALNDIRNRSERENAMQTLLDCAGNPDRYFDAADAAELRAAFTRIATQLNNLRLTN